jgi:hypothetical protein
VPGYPPEPWQLRGQLHLSAFLVSPAAMPVELPPGCRPVRLGRFGVVGVAWVSYEPGGVLSYDELMATLLVRHGRRLMPTITHIWVDSEASRDGGRELWGIPKQLAAFDFAARSFTAADDNGPIATARVRPIASLPGRWPVRFRVVQRLHGAAKASPVRARARLQLARISLDAAAEGPLGFLSGGRPLLSVSLRDFRMRFGGG